MELFNDKNVALQTKVDLLSQEYQEVSGAMTVEFDGKERTMQEMAKFLMCKCLSMMSARPAR